MLNHRLLVLLPLLIGMGGCVHNQAWRAPGTETAIDDGSTPYGNVLDSFQHTNKQREVVENRYDLFICEFDDAGIAFAPEQINEALQRLEDHLKTKPALIVTFAHGWRHNAKPDDENLTLFRWSLLNLARTEQDAAKRENRAPRQIFAFYLGWRGQSTDIPFADVVFTTWGRKASANRVGTIGAPQVVTQTIHHYTERKHRERTELRAGEAPTRSIAIGHSYGTIVIGQSYLPWITSYIADPQTKRPADLVLFLNPAFEAIRVESLYHLVSPESATPLVQASSLLSEPPLFATITAENDQATKIFFPLSRGLRPITHKYRDKQLWQDLKTVGHYEPFRTDLLHLGARQKGTAPTFGSGLMNEANFADMEDRNEADDVHFESYAMPVTPLIRTIYADKSIIDGHGLPSPNHGGGGSYGALIRAITLLMMNTDKASR